MAGSGPTRSGRERRRERQREEALEQERWRREQEDRIALALVELVNGSRAAFEPLRLEGEETRIGREGRYVGQGRISRAKHCRLRSPCSLRRERRGTSNDVGRPDRPDATLLEHLGKSSTKISGS